MRDFSGTLCSSVKQIKAPSLLDSEQEIALHAIQWNQASLIAQQAGSLMVFLELRWEPGVCSRVKAGVAIKNICLFSDIRTPV